MLSGAEVGPKTGLEEINDDLLEHLGEGSVVRSLSAPGSFPLYAINFLHSRQLTKHDLTTTVLNQFLISNSIRPQIRRRQYSGIPVSIIPLSSPRAIRRNQ